MIEKLRLIYNQQFSESTYQEMLNSIAREFDYRPTFRIAESPIFLSAELVDEIQQASNRIIEFITSEDFWSLTSRSIPPENIVPNEDKHPHFFSIDYALVEDGDKVRPKLIEVQGFPSLFGYQPHLAKHYKEHFGIPSNMSSFIDVDEQQYFELLKEVIIGDEQVENVVIMDIDPPNQYTYIDFLYTKALLGVEPVCVSDVWEEGSKLYYRTSSGEKSQIKRIYNRCIFDELVTRKDLDLRFSFQKEYEVKWVTHPNHFFRISKFILPYLKEDFVPTTHFLHELEEYPEDIENYVLKPLFSFSGSGVVFDLTESDLETINDPENYILQQKVSYAPVLKSPSGPVKCELRVMVLWPEQNIKPTQAIILARLSKGKMIGVKYNKDFDWVGGSTAFFEKRTV